MKPNKNSKFLFLIISLLVLSECSSFSIQELEAVESLLNRLDTKKPSPSEQESAARGVLQRLLPTYLSSFEFKIITKFSDNRVYGNSDNMIDKRLQIGLIFFKVSNEDDPFRKVKFLGTIFSHVTSMELNYVLETTPWVYIVLEIAFPMLEKDKGTTAVDITSGLHWYLKYWCGAHVSWDKTGGAQLGSVLSQDHYLPFLCLVGLGKMGKRDRLDGTSGVNLPLAFTGQEAIWQKEFNITKQDLNDFFGGPAFLAWARMVLPSFSGNVPAALKAIFPTANISRLGDWNTVDGDPRWCCTYLLDPSDPLFIEIGEAFMKQQIKEYGDVTDIYSCDTFNENSPPTNDPTYISSLGSAVYEAMSKADNDAVWLMQSVAGNGLAILFRLIILETTTDEGEELLECMLHNFGGNIEMYGILDAVASGPIDARVSENSTMSLPHPILQFTKTLRQIGVGMCMEGIEQNPVVYELMSEMAFRSDRFQLEEWLTTYSHRRYGKSVYQVEDAWKILHHTIYNCTDGIADHNTDYIVKFPDWDPSVNNQLGVPEIIQRHKLAGVQQKIRFFFHETSSSLPQPHMWYKNKDAVRALKLFLDAGNELAELPTYRYDLVDLTRQSLSKLANEIYLSAIHAFWDKDAKALSLHCLKFLQLIKDIDKLLAADDNFLLGTWLESAKKLSLNADEMQQYEWNARTQVTMWYDNTKYVQSKLHDYANKFWSGLLEDYYLPRASMYFTRLLKSLKENEDFKMEEWRKEWIAFSNKWQAGVELYPVKAQGDALAIAKELYQKYFT
ncbi:hypothetical protein DH2020_025711 [Rehmannia glutinosa]|uniref:Alpha-N-acetylglucosaminidase n=1 Tax=Rehmannia glutinosa TaxID=99300 RepID=A0ABR0W2H9_REHGL